MTLKLEISMTHANRKSVLKSATNIVTDCGPSPCGLNIKLNEFGDNVANAKQWKWPNACLIAIKLLLDCCLFSCILLFNFCLTVAALFSCLFACNVLSLFGCASCCCSSDSSHNLHMFVETLLGCKVVGLL